MTRCLAVVLLALASLLGACLPLPAQSGPAVTGRLVDEATGDPIAGAIVVVRYDTRHDDLLPDRDLLAHVEVETDAAGRFEAGPVWAPGVGIWPMARVEARVMSVIREGYLCAGPLAVPPTNALEIALAPTGDPADRRISCRPVAARPAKIPRYLAAWRSLGPAESTPEARVRGREIERVLDARAALGFGANCEGPAADLAVAPGGQRVAFRMAEPTESWVGIVAAAGARPIDRLPLTMPASGRWQLGWTDPDELVLWEPTNDFDQTHSLAVVSLAGGAPKVVWRAPAPGPAAPAYEFELSRSHDRARSLSQGRSFELERGMDPVTGLARETLRVTAESGSSQAIGLPGEPCGLHARGEIHRRIADEGRTAFDLRHVRGGCRVVAVDLWSGAWRIVDDARSGGTCRDSRTLPASQLSTALGAYVDDLEMALEAGGADPKAAYSIRIDPEGATSVAGRGYDGEPRVVAAPTFPVDTPLRRIDVSVLGADSGRAREPSGAGGLEPL